MDRTDPKITKNAGSGLHLEDELECDDNRSARRSTFECSEETMDQFQKCKVEAATESLQVAYKRILNLTPDTRRSRWIEVERCV